MKKIFSVFLIFVAIAGCNDDDSATEIPADEKFLTSLETFLGIIDIEYNDKNLISKIEIPQQLVYLFSYDELDRLASFQALGANSGTATFQYGNQDFPFSYTIDEMVTPINYNAANRSIDGKIFMTPENDLKKFIAEDGEISELVYLTTQKGNLYNTANILPLLLLFDPSNALSLNFFMTRRPVEYISQTDGLISAEHVFDNQGFVSEST